MWQVSHSAELLFHNPDYHSVFMWNDSDLRYAFLLHRQRMKLSYAAERVPRKEEVPPSEHILAALCRKAGIKGTVALRPYIYLTEDEKKSGRKFENQINVQCVGETSFCTVMRNKLWSVDKFQEVVDGIRDDSSAHIAVIQVGTVGLGMHLARVVDCRAVIIYGGREHSWQTGYTCNENINSLVDCAPCWKWNDCDYERKCMTMISTKNVLSAVERSLKRSETPIETDSIGI